MTSVFPVGQDDPGQEELAGRGNRVGAAPYGGNGSQPDTDALPPAQAHVEYRAVGVDDDGTRDESDYTDTLREANEDRVAMLDSEPPFTSVFIEQRTVTRTPWVAVRDDDSEATR